MRLGCFDGQACLAGAARPGEREQAAIRVAQQRGDFGQFVHASDKGHGLRRHAARVEWSGRSRRRRSWARRGSRLAHAETFKQRSRLRLRFCAQLFLQYSRAFLILAQGGGVLTRLLVHPHQLSVRGFVQRVERQPAPRKRDRGFRVSLLAMAAHERFERTCQIAAQSLGFKEQPVVEGRCVLQAEPGQ